MMTKCRQLVSIMAQNTGDQDALLALYDTSYSLHQEIQVVAINPQVPLLMANKQIATSQQHYREIVSAMCAYMRHPVESALSVYSATISLNLLLHLQLQRY